MTAIQAIERIREATHSSYAYELEAIETELTYLKRIVNDLDKRREDAVAALQDARSSDDRFST